jgi:hypothetical protein
MKLIHRQFRVRGSLLPESLEEPAYLRWCMAQALKNPPRGLSRQGPIAIEQL